VGEARAEEALSQADQLRLESLYKSIGSSVCASKCAAALYTTDLQCLIRLLDWQRQCSGVPLWVFNTGLNPKRPKGKLSPLCELDVYQQVCGRTGREGSSRNL
jgi:hypothetical protein